MVPERLNTDASVDPLDMNNYRIERLPKRKKSRVETFLANIGGPLAILAFVVIYFLLEPGFLENIKAGSLSDNAKAVYQNIS